MSNIGRIACLCAMIIVALNGINAFVECGPFECAEDPIQYWLLN